MKEVRFINDDGYVLIKRDGKLLREHRLVYEREVGPIPAGWHIHHVNEDTADNRIENLEALPWPLHKRRHCGHVMREGVWWKTCTSCGVHQPESEFPTKKIQGGVRYTRGNCIECERERQRVKTAKRKATLNASRS